MKDMKMFYSPFTTFLLSSQSLFRKLRKTLVPSFPNFPFFHPSNVSSSLPNKRYNHYFLSSLTFLSFFLYIFLPCHPLSQTKNLLPFLPSFCVFLPWLPLFPKLKLTTTLPSHTYHHCQRGR